LKAAQERWDALREVIQARKTGDYSRALTTGLCVRRERVIGTGENAKLIEEYEVDTELLDAMAHLEKQVAIETGQWTEKQDVSVRPEIAARAATLKNAFSMEELEVIKARMLAVASEDDRPEGAESVRGAAGEPLAPGPSRHEPIVSGPRTLPSKVIEPRAEPVQKAEQPEWMR
jgi:hypothetical protein